LNPILNPTFGNGRLSVKRPQKRGRGLSLSGPFTPGDTVTTIRSDNRSARVVLAVGKLRKKTGFQRLWRHDHNAVRLGRHFEALIVGGEGQTLCAGVLQIAGIVYADIVPNRQLKQGRNIVRRWRFRNGQPRQFPPDLFGSFERQLTTCDGFPESISYFDLPNRWDHRAIDSGFHPPQSFIRCWCAAICKTPR